jgi:Zn finger protein HypA/HybF involved in hydrogenase expression
MKRKITISILILTLLFVITTLATLKLVNKPEITINDISKTIENELNKYCEIIQINSDNTKTCPKCIGHKFDIINKNNLYEAVGEINLHYADSKMIINNTKFVIQIDYNNNIILSNIQPAKCIDAFQS